MKLRKHKTNKTFRISFTTQSPGWTETHLTGQGGDTREVAIEGKISLPQSVIAVGSDAPSVLRAFLFGRDVHNVLTAIRPV